MKKVENFQDFIKESIDVKRIDSDTNLKASDFEKFKSNGLKVYYYENVGDKFGFIEITKPVEKWSKPKEVFILTADEFEKLDKVTRNVKEILKHMYEEIRLRKLQVPAVARALIEKNDKNK